MVLMLIGCLAHHPPTQAAASTEVDVVAALSGVAAPTVTGPTDTLKQSLSGALGPHNLTVKFAPEDSFATAFQTTRDTGHRLNLLHATEPLLLVETETSFYSELSGRYRWVVHTTLSLQPAGLSDSFDVPVFLQYAHEQEAEAVDQAAPVIARHAGDLVDSWLRTL